MAKPYSQDLRDRLVRAVLAGQSRRKAARGFDVSASCVIKLMQQFETTGDWQPRKFGGHKRHALAAHEAKVRALVTAQPDLTITELWSKLTTLEIKVGRSAVGRFLLHLQLTFRKKTLHAAEQERADVQAARLAWCEMQKGLDPKKLVFIDETWASTNMTPRYGRCERGKRLIAHAPFGHWKTTTFLAALRHDRITAPCVFDGPINGAKFLAYVEQVLVPTLSPGEIVVMDNISSASSGRSTMPTQRPFRGEYRAPNGIFYKVTGNGEPLLLLHGLMVTGAMFDPLVVLLQSNFRMIIPDLRGHGQSGDLSGPYDDPGLSATGYVLRACTRSRRTNRRLALPWRFTSAAAAAVSSKDRSTGLCGYSTAGP
jgi:transposase